jgi:hypothetical protein
VSDFEELFPSYAFAFYHVRHFQLPQVRISSRVLHQKATCTLYWGRDPLGRRSLLIRRPTSEDPRLILASVGDGNVDYEEVAADSIHSVSLVEKVQFPSA